MKKLIRKWNVALRKRRLRSERRTLGQYKDISQEIGQSGQQCMNCKVPLTGPFCHICGQKDDDLRRPFWTFFRELLDNTFSFDSKLIKSLLLLVLVPGGLTRAYMMGRRARFVPPLRLYIVASVSFFLILSLFDILILDVNVSLKEEVKEQEATQVQTGEGDTAVSPSSETPAVPPANGSPSPLGNTGSPTEADAAGAAETQANENRITLRDQLKELAQKEGFSDEKIAELNDELNSLEAEIDLDQPADIGLNSNRFPYNVDVAMFVRDKAATRSGLRQKDIDRIQNAENTPDFVKNALVGFSKALVNPKEFNDLINDWLPYALFALMPFFAFLLRLFHWGEHQYYMNQLVFSLHFHSFLFLMLSALILIVPRYGGEFGFSLFWWGTSLHFMIALKVGQDQGWLKAFFKAGAIWFLYFIVMVPVLAFAVMRGLQDI